MAMLVALMPAVVILAACGARAPSSEQAAEGLPSTSVAANGDTSSTTATDNPQSVPAVREMSVFLRPRTDADVLPNRLSYRLDREPCTDWERAHGGCLGDPIPDDSRLLLAGLGVGKTSLYAWPTTNGGVCFAWDDGAGGCVHDFAQVEDRAAFMGIDPDQEGVGAPGTLVGVVPDDVAAAEVKVRGVDQAAVLRRNGVFYELPDGSCTNWAFESLTLSYRDGGSATIPIKWQHGSRTLPDTCRA